MTLLETGFPYDDVSRLVAPTDLVWSWFPCGRL